MTAHRPTCNCNQYAFPHRAGGGACKGAGYCRECRSGDVREIEIGAYWTERDGADCVAVRAECRECGGEAVTA